MNLLYQIKTERSPFILVAEGNIALFLDADGSVGLEEVRNNLHYILGEDYDIFVDK